MFTEFGRPIANEDPDDITEPTHNGAPTVDQVSAAIQTWSLCQMRARNTFANPRIPTVHEAALAFGLPVALIVEAVEHHYWMFIGRDSEGRDVIEHEGA